MKNDLKNNNNNNNKAHDHRALRKINIADISEINNLKSHSLRQPMEILTTHNNTDLFETNLLVKRDLFKILILEHSMYEIGLFIVIWG